MTKQKNVAFDEDYQSILVVALNVACTSKGSFLPQLLARHIRKNLAIMSDDFLRLLIEDIGIKLENNPMKITNFKGIPHRDVFEELYKYMVNYYEKR